jgi:hypothetical protein
MEPTSQPGPSIGGLFISVRSHGGGTTLWLAWGRTHRSSRGKSKSLSQPRMGDNAYTIKLGRRVDNPCTKQLGTTAGKKFQGLETGVCTNKEKEERSAKMYKNHPGRTRLPRPGQGPPVFCIPVFWEHGDCQNRVPNDLHVPK